MQQTSQTICILWVVITISINHVSYIFQQLLRQICIANMLHSQYSKLCTDSVWLGATESLGFGLVFGAQLLAVLVFYFTLYCSVSSILKTFSSDAGSAGNALKFVIYKLDMPLWILN